MNFVGAKRGAGIAEWIISQMPPHSLYVEPFLGTGAVMRLKRPAARTIGVEADRQVIADYAAGITAGHGSEGLEIIEGDGRMALRLLRGLGLPADALVYCDPPYLGSVRSQVNRVYYGREMLSEAEHRELLELLLSLRCQVMLSGYWSELYASMLPGWRVASKWTVNRGGTRVQEWLWLNFAEPAKLHDARFVGANFTERQRIKRKVARWQQHFASMRADERAAVWAMLSCSVDGADCGGPQPAAAVGPGPPGSIAVAG